MLKYHLNPTTGEPGRCTAQNGNCPFATEEEHFVTLKDARKAFEDEMGSSWVKMPTRATSTLENTEDLLAHLISFSDTMESDLNSPGEIKAWRNASELMTGYYKIVNDPYRSNIYDVPPEEYFRNQFMSKIDPATPPKEFRRFHKSLKSLKTVAQLNAKLEEMQANPGNYPVMIPIASQRLQEQLKGALAAQEVATNGSTHKERLNSLFIEKLDEAKSTNDDAAAEVYEDILLHSIPEYFNSSRKKVVQPRAY